MEKGTTRTRNELASFEAAVLTHLDAAYNLARWLTRDESDAEDVVQEAMLRAYRFFGSFRGPDGRAWLLAIVRNTCRTWMRRNRSPEFMSEAVELDEVEAGGMTPEELLIRNADGEALRRALEELPAEFREALVLREFEGLSYKEIALVTDSPVGTVMSRLARARARLQRSLAVGAGAEVKA
ncbi:MAG TPA: sigma-70 family RNA polymerase sigma factor [Pyrinomonadaceae bacterium]|nr:sigma-70 family RNA polymerase sigma factor [Pyrinomonadaceae bacterium]